MTSPVRPHGIRSPNEGTPRRGWIVVAGILAVVAGGIVLVAGPTAVDPAPPPVEFPDRIVGLTDTADPDAADTLALIADLEEALDAGDVDAAASLVSGDFVWLELPGSINPVIPARASDLHDRLAFVAGTASIDFGRCRSDVVDGPGGESRRVVCPNVDVEGDYTEGLRRQGDGQRVAISLRDGEVISVFWSLREQDPIDMHSYCAFARDRFPERAATAFDESCVPIETAATVSDHAALAAAFVAAGSPTLDEPGLATRSREIAAGFVDAHNSGGDPMTSTSRDFFVVRFPGLLLTTGDAPFPSFSSFLAWSSEVYEIDLGTCTSRLMQASWPVRVDCPEATWTGPLPELLGLEPVVQSLSFLVDDFELIGYIGFTDHVLFEAAHDLCLQAWEDDPEAAAQAFRADCAPIHDRSGAAALLDLAARFATSDG